MKIEVTVVFPSDKDYKKEIYFMDIEDISEKNIENCIRNCHGIPWEQIMFIENIRWKHLNPDHRIYLWIDDIRDPEKYLNLDKSYIILWARSYDSAKRYIDLYRPDVVDFDHDLGEEKTGYDVAKYIVHQCMENKSNLPEYKIHSANPVGRENIDKLLQNYMKFISNN